MNNKKVRYRIKVETYGNGDKRYYAQKRVLWNWLYLCYDGSETLFIIDCCDRSEAISRIKLNYNKSYKMANKIFDIRLEYITKP